VVADHPAHFNREMVMKEIGDPVAYAKTAVDAYKKLYGTDCISVILYGSAAGGDFNPKKSDINLLIVLSSMDPALIAKSAGMQVKYERSRFCRPLILDKDYIAHSCDSYPMEFLDMKGCYQVLFGEDVLSPIVPDREHLRLQVERELKGKWLHLVHEFTFARKNRKNLSRLVQLSLKAYTPVFRALLVIKDMTVPRNRNDLFKDIEAAYSLTDRPFQNVAASLNTGSLAELEHAFVGYAMAIKKIIDFIDHT
jgi:hypothetical protein